MVHQQRVEVSDPALWATQEPLAGLAPQMSAASATGAVVKVADFVAHCTQAVTDRRSLRSVEVLPVRRAGGACVARKEVGADWVGQVQAVDCVQARQVVVAG